MSQPLSQPTSQTWKGIQPQLLIQQVNNTAPFIFLFDEFEGDGFIRALKELKTNPEVSLPQYFNACIAAHFATVATLVPTDLDQTIRLKLWSQATPDDILEMSQSVISFLTWNEKAISRRWVTSPNRKIHLSGHTGEWFTLAIPAWHHCLKYNLKTEAENLESLIIQKIEEHHQAFSEFIKADLPIETLKASSIIAHNLGDLDRVIDLWEVSKENKLRNKIYNLGHSKAPEFESLSTAGELNKAIMASENHRHYALREARILRHSTDFLVGIGPFFDSWGHTISKHPLVAQNDLGEIATILIDAWVKLNKSEEVFGYARAIAGIISGARGGQDSILKEIPASRRKTITSGPLRRMLDRSQSEFENLFASKCRKFLLKMN